MARTLGWTCANVAVWTMIATVTATDVWLRAAGAPERPAWPDVFLLHWGLWLPWTLAVPAAFRLARRVVARGSSWPVASGCGLLFVVGWIAIYTPAFTAVVHAFAARPWAEYPQALAAAFGFKLYVDAFLALVVLLVAFATESWLRSQRERQRSRELTAVVAQAELAALKAQLHPHFLFNALHSISGLIRNGERQVALEVVADLSDLLRYTLETEPDQRVPLSREIEQLETYLRIQRARFGDRLTATLAVDADAATVEVPATILQPLVENAVRHGVRTRGPSEVRVAAHRDEHTLHLAIANTCAETPSGGFGIGLDNTRQRLARIYGDAAHLTLERTRAGWVETRLDLPIAS